MERRIGFVSYHARQRARERIPSLAYVSDSAIPGPLLAAWYDGAPILRNAVHEWRLCRFRKDRSKTSYAAVLVVRPGANRGEWTLVTVMTPEQAWNDIESGKKPKLARLMGVQPKETQA